MVCEDPAYLSQQLITYLGNKRRLLPYIGQAIFRVRQRLGTGRLRILDLFSGSGVVARFCKQYASLLLVNDLEAYAQRINHCYLSNRSELDLKELRAMHQLLLSRLETEPFRPGLLQELYAPRDDQAIRAGERVFYTRRNAAYLDSARQYLGELPEGIQPFFLGPLLSEASIHANTAGVFKGFYKDSRTGLGRFGGRKADALNRITGPIGLPFPLFSRFECPVRVYREDANRLAAGLAACTEPLAGSELDLAYLDPPYNQHPYGSNYFMLNLISDYRRPERISPVSGIPGDWQRSDYNKAAKAGEAMARLVSDLPARFLLVSFNSEGFISREAMLGILEAVGRVEVMEIRYNTYRGSRNLRGRPLHVHEYLYLVEKG